MNTQTREEKLDVIAAALDGHVCQWWCGTREQWIDEQGIWNVSKSVALNKKVRIKPQEDPYKELKEAHAAGRDIEWLNGLGAWSHTLNPTWDYPIARYRIKPAPERVPLTASDIPVPCWLTEASNLESAVIALSDDTVYTLTGWHTFVSMMEKGFQYSTDRKSWQPCSKEAP